MENMEKDIRKSLRTLQQGGVILYPTDTVWGIGCDATHAEAIARIFRIKNRDDKKSMIILVADEQSISRYVEDPDPAIFPILASSTRPTTVIYEKAKNLPKNLINEDGSIAIRIVKEPFCRELISQLKKPIVSTSSNVSGRPTPHFFDEVAKEIKDRMDYIVEYRQGDKTPSQPSRIIKLLKNGERWVIRE